MANPEPIRRRRRWRTVLGALAVLVLLLGVGFVAALPYLMGTAPVKRWMLARAERAMRPAGFTFTTIRFSWFGPTRIDGFALIDPQGDRVLSAPHAVWDRRLWQVLFERPKLGTLLLDRGALDVERAPDGTIDLAQTIQPLLGLNPKTDLTIKIEHGTLRFRAVGQPAPVLADDAHLIINLPPRPGPVAWRLRLANATPRPVALAVEGSYQREPSGPGTPSDLTVSIQCERWPWTIASGGVVASGVLDGGLTVQRQSGRWISSGGAAVLALDAAGPRLAGDHLRADRVSATWNVRQTERGWTFRALKIDAPFGMVKATGTLPALPDEPSRLEGTLDLAALARQLPHALRLRDGLVLERGAATIKAESNQRAWDLEAHLSDLAARDADHAFTLREPAALAARLAPEAESGRFAVERLTLRSAFLDATAHGDLARGLTWSGTLDLAGFQRQFGDLIDLGTLQLAGKGEFQGGYQVRSDSFSATSKGTMRGLKIEGIGGRTIARDAVALDLSIGGPASASGLPAGAETIALDLTSGATAGALLVQGDRIGLSWMSPVTLSGASRQAEGRLAARRDARVVTIDSLWLALGKTPDDAPAPGERERDAGRFAPVPLPADTPQLFAQGRYDASGTLTLTPVARPDAMLALAPEGISVSGIGQGAVLKGSVGLVADLDACRRAGIVPDLDALAGSWQLRANFGRAEGVLKVGAAVGRAGHSAPGEGPLDLALLGLYDESADRLDLRELTLRTPFGTLDGSGRLDDLTGRRVADLRGSVAPDWNAVNRRLAARVEPGARVEGKARPWALAGPLSGGSVATVAKHLDGEFGIDLTAADVYGMKLGPTPVVLRAQGGTLAFDAIDATLNGGTIHLEPGLVLDDPKGAAITLGPDSTVTDAGINEEVSHRVLSFVAPVLDRATRVNGRVSVELDGARFPLVAEASKSMTVSGEVLFQDVAFVPGPLADELLALVGREGRPLMRLDQPIALTIADRKVHQRGLALPLGKLSRIEIDGWVDFDKRLELTASLPVTPAMVLNRPLLSDIVEGARIDVPIRGTLAAPEIDREAMSRSLAGLGRTLLERGIGRGAAEIFSRMTRPRDPNAPPPLTREQRRARRRGLLP